MRGLTEGNLDPHRVWCVYRAFGGRSLFPSTVRSLVPVALKACLKVDLTEAPSNAGTFHASASPSFFLGAVVMHLVPRVLDNLTGAHCFSYFIISYFLKVAQLFFFFPF